MPGIESEKITSIMIGNINDSSHIGTIYDDPKDFLGNGIVTVTECKCTEDGMTMRDINGWN
jgi:hypothetical protein